MQVCVDLFQAKTTRCGHVFCYACVLHYLSVTDEDGQEPPAHVRFWRKCPICYDPVFEHDLRRFRFHLTPLWDSNASDRLELAIEKV